MKLVFSFIENIAHLTDVLMEVEPSITVLELKQQLSCLVGCHHSLFELLAVLPHAKVPLAEENPLALYSLQEESVIEVNSLGLAPAFSADCPTPPPNSPALSNAIEFCKRGDLRNLNRVLAVYEAENPEEDDLASQALASNWGLVHFASYTGNAAVLQFLVARDANINKVTVDEWTPFQLACYLGNFECAGVLLECGKLQINKVTRFRGTGLHLACEAADLALVQLILAKDPCLSIEDHRGRQLVEVAPDCAVLEAIAVAAGEKQLSRYKALESTLPTDFYYDVWVSSPFYINDKHIFLHLNAHDGTLDYYSSKEDFLDNREPVKSRPLADIQEVKVYRSRFFSSSQHYFTIESSRGSFRYYTKFREVTEEWVERIKDAVNYCLIHKPQQSCVLGLELEDAPSEEPVKEALDLASFHIAEEVGAGAFGKVYRVLKVSDSAVYAMKMLNKSTLQKHRQLKFAIRECKIMKQLDHPFIVTLYYAFQTKKHLILVLEFCSGGDLLCLIEQQQKLSEGLARFYLAQIILAIEYLHTADIIYRDLKPANVLIGADGYVRLGDFNLAKENVTEKNPAMTMAGSPAYLAPEIVSGRGASKASDIYGLGAILYELVVGTPPYYHADLNALFKSIEAQQLKFPRHVSCITREFIGTLMHKNPAKRPQISQIKRNGFFRKLDWDALLAKRMKPPKITVHFYRETQDDSGDATELFACSPMTP